MITKKTGWLSAHLHYTEPWDEFLKDAVYPIIQKATQQKGVDGFFFIRYWEEGDHIRLRFHGEIDSLNEVVKTELDAFFADYFRGHPSSVRVIWKGFEDRLKSNNQVHFVKYEPEVDRYGGALALSECEKQFELSSKLILDLISTSRDWDYNQAMGAAIQFHILFIKTLNMKLPQAIQFLQFVFDRWVDRAQNVAVRMGEDQPKEKKEPLEIFESSFASQKATLEPLVRSLWHSDKEDFERDSVLYNWIVGNQNFKEDLTRLLNDQKLVVISTPNTWGYDAEKYTIWNIYESLVHMTNNRLGIRNMDESYIAFILWKCLQNQVGN